MSLLQTDLIYDPVCDTVKSATLYACNDDLRRIILHLKQNGTVYLSNFIYNSELLRASNNFLLTVVRLQIIVYIFVLHFYCL